MASNPFDQFDTTPVVTRPLTGPRAPAPKTATEQAIDEERLRSERLANKKAEEDQSGVIDIPGDRTKTGEEYLHSLSPADAGIVRAMIDGRSSIPAGYSMRSQRAQQLLAMAAQADPTFDAANLPARIATRKAFTSGKQGQNIVSFNTALGHLERLARSAEALDNTSFPIINRLRNTFFQHTGHPEVDTFNTDRQAVVDELTRAFRGTGGNVSDLVDWERKINDAKSPQQLRAVIGEAATLLQSRIDATGQAYNEGMKTTGQPLPMLYPHSVEALQALQSPDYHDKGFGAIAAQFPDGGKPGEGGNSGPLDPTGTGDIGFHGTGPHQNDIVAVDQGRLREWQSFVGKFRPGQMDDAHLADAMAKSYEQMLGRPLLNAANIASIYNKTGQIPAAVQYQPVGDLKAKMDEEQRGQDLIDRQDVSGERGSGGVGETVDAAVRGAGNFLTYGGADKLSAGLSTIFNGDTYENNLAHERAIDQYDSRNHFVSQLVGSSLGVLGNETALARAGNIPALGRVVSRIPEVARPALGDALYGAGYGAVDSDGSFSDRLEAGLKGARNAALGGVVGRGATRLVGATLRPVVAPAVERLTQRGITLTPGQILGANDSALGRSIKWIEDKATSRLGLGDFIANARRGGVQDFNRAAGNDALDVLGRELPPDVAPGHSMVQHLQDVREEAYDTALEPLRAYRDDQLASDIQDIASRVRPDQRDAFTRAIQDRVTPHLPDEGPLTGRQLQRIKRGLNERIYELRRDVNGSDLANDLADVRDSFMSFAQRNDPTNMAAYRAADAFNSRLSRIEDAAARTKDGIFTPNQFRTAIGRKGFGTTTANLAAGEAPFQQLATDASTILPSSVPDSGSAGRIAAMAAFPALGGLGGGALASENDNSFLTGAALGAAMFTRPGLRGMQYALTGSRGRPLNSLGSFLREGGTTAPVRVGDRLILPPLKIVPPDIAGAAALSGVTQSGGY